MDPHPEYVEDLQEHVQHTRDHSIGLDPSLWGPSSLPYTVLPPSTIWSPEEKHRFFHALSRHSRLRPDLIAQEIGGSKSVVEVCVYLDALDRAVAEDSRPSLKFPLAVDVPVKIIRFEENQSRILRELEIKEARSLDSDEEEESNSAPTSDDDEDPAVEGPLPRKRRRIEQKGDSESAPTAAKLHKPAPDPQEKKATEEGFGDAEDDDDEGVLNKQNVVRLARFYFHNVKSHKGKLQRLRFTEELIPEDIFIELNEVLIHWLQCFIRSLVLRVEAERVLLDDDQRASNHPDTFIVLARDVESLLVASRQARSKKQFISHLPHRLHLSRPENNDGTLNGNFREDRSPSASSSDDEREDPSSIHSAHVWHPAVLKSVERPPRSYPNSEIGLSDAEDRELSSGSETEGISVDIEDELVQNAIINQREVNNLLRRYFGTIPEGPSELGATRTNSARYSAEQIAILEEAFTMNAFPDAFGPIAGRCGLSRSQARDWFKYHRRKRGIQRYGTEGRTRDRSQGDDSFDNAPPAHTSESRTSLPRRAKNMIQRYF
ncbi:hypothetical protein FRC04_006511 [Tulasnella sp. 424]|nr:hypothetical protein FRC04_006511 [Tulasnella sp. 424]